MLQTELIKLAKEIFYKADNFLLISHNDMSYTYENLTGKDYIKENCLTCFKDKINEMKLIVQILEHNPCPECKPSTSVNNAIIDMAIKYPWEDELPKEEPTKNKKKK
jgi:hypothetical protein